MCGSDEQLCIYKEAPAKKRKQNCIGHRKTDTLLLALPKDLAYNIIRLMNTVSYYPGILLTCWAPKDVKLGHVINVVTKLKGQFAKTNDWRRFCSGIITRWL